MTYRVLASICAFAGAGAMLLMTATPVAGQERESVVKSGGAADTKSAAKAWTPPRTPDGHPDLQGVWDYRTLTRLERPKELGTKAFFTADEAAKFEKEESLRQNRDLIVPGKGGNQYPAGGVVAYNEAWYDRGNKVEGTMRTSLIIDPPDGRIPWTAAGEALVARHAEEVRHDMLGHPKADSWEDRPLSERCLEGFNAGPPMTPGEYNNNVQIFQAGDYVAILNEMIHDVRIIPSDGRPHGNIPQWKGDSVGHWEGDTLVIDTINFRQETSLFGSSANMHLVERLTRTGPDKLLYEFTVEDPKMFTRPWTAQVPMLKSNELIYEYACHEGNYAMTGILAGARAEEKRAAEEAAKKASN